ncbi:MAG: hypothetical protein H6815_05055 [Phycisphaeraceae bacterium]|nr:hypothetical protein [Phycisphaerales bacterium]MCB9859804.1 hypothetical protein [Phycisphaeraceae bacterium]
MKVVRGGMVVAALASGAQAQLVDPGFESNALGVYTTVLNNFTTQQGIWAPESGARVGTTGAVTPASGNFMLQMNQNGGVVTQAWQVTDMAPYAAAISAGTATFNLDALFNSEGQPSPQGYIRLNFYSGPSLSNYTSSISSGTFTLDNTPTTWENFSATGTIPIGTTWVTTEFGFVNSTMGGFPGFVDNARLQIVPAPGPVSLMAAAGLIAVRRRRAR